MRFQLTIELGNDAMRDTDHVSKALKGVARLLDYNDVADCDKLSAYDRQELIRDDNGNTVGKWEVIDDQPALPWQAQRGSREPVPLPTLPRVRARRNGYKPERGAKARTDAPL